MDKLRFLSLNVSSIRQKDRRNKFISRYVYPTTGPSPDILFFQDTRSFPGCEKEWKSEFKYNLFFKHDSDHGGLLIGINRSIGCVVKKCVRLPLALILHCTIEGEDYLFVNVYFRPQLVDTGSTNATVEALQELFVAFSQFNVPRVILGGDFNMMMDVDCDSIFPDKTAHSARPIANNFSEFCEGVGLSDVWRTVHPQRKQLTHASKSSAKRLDYFLISDLMLNYLDSASIGMQYLSDHSPIFCTFLLNRNPKGSRFFRFPDYLLKDEKFKKDYTDHFNDYIKLNVTDVPRADRPRDGVIWDTLKAMTRGFTISRMAYDRKQKAIDPDLVRKVRSLESRRDCAEDIDEFLQSAKELASMTEELNRALTYREESRASYSSSRFQAYSDVCSKYFFRKIKGIPGALRHIFDFKRQCDVYSDFEILEICREFYSNLYNRSSPSFVRLSNFFDYIPDSACLSDSDKDILSQDITLDELTVALNDMKKDSSPGFDGLTVRFYKTFWPLLGKWVLASLSDAFAAGSCTVDQRRGIVRLLPKRNKPTHFVRNLRPISVLNVDFKLLTKTLAIRMRDIMPTIIHPDQNGFIRHRFLGDNVMDIYSLLATVRSMEDADDMCFFSVDIYKAFDSVSHTFLRTTLETLGFPPVFLKWVSVIHSNVELRVANNNHLSDPIYPKCGVAQGCPLSPYLFLISIESLAHFIRADNQIEGFSFQNREKRICLIADDTLLAIRGSPTVFHRLREVLDHFHHISGLSVNYDKSVVVHISNLPPPLGFQLRNLNHLGRLASGKGFHTWV